MASASTRPRSSRRAPTSPRRAKAKPAQALTSADPLTAFQVIACFPDGSKSVVLLTAELDRAENYQRGYNRLSDVTGRTAEIHPVQVPGPAGADPSCFQRFAVIVLPSDVEDTHETTDLKKARKMAADLNRVVMGLGCRAVVALVEGGAS